MAHVKLTQDYPDDGAYAGECGDTVERTRREGKVDVSITHRSNGTRLEIPVYVARVPLEHLHACQKHAGTYSTRSGDTLGRIAEFHDSNVDDLLELNPQLDTSADLSVGGTINVPEVGEQGTSIHAALAHGDGPLWYEIAMREMDTGVDEISGPDTHNPRIVEYHQATGLQATDDETPWCSSFVNWCFLKADMDRTNSAAARSWLRWGAALDAPQKGCVAVFNRPPSPTSGHVALYIGEEGDRILVLGGNQSNQVNITGYPSSRLLGYRWPTDA